MLAVHNPEPVQFVDVKFIPYTQEPTYCAASQPEKKTKGPPTSYNIFYRKNVEIVKARSDVDGKAIPHVMGAWWKRMTAEERSPYEKEAQSQRVQFLKENPEYMKRKKGSKLVSENILKPQPTRINQQILPDSPPSFSSSSVQSPPQSQENSEVPEIKNASRKRNADPEDADSPPSFSPSSSSEQSPPQSQEILEVPVPEIKKASRKRNADPEDADEWSSYCDLDMIHPTLIVSDDFPWAEAYKSIGLDENDFPDINC